MTTILRNRASTRGVAVVRIVAVLFVIAALGVAGYALRGRLFTQQGQEVQAPPDEHAEHVMADAGQEPGASDAVPRAPVTLDIRRQQLIGVRTAPVERTDEVETIRALGTVKYDETRLVDVNLKLDGWIEELLVDYTGQFVNKGQPLFTVYSPDLLTTQNEYLLALKTRDQLGQSQIPDVRESAEQLVASAHQRLELWDIPPDELKAIDDTRQARKTITFRSPVSGYVIDKQIVKGMHVAPGQSLYRVADLSRVWVEADVYEQEMSMVRVGAPAVITLDAYPGAQFKGRAVYIYPFVEERTRTIRMRFEFPNSQGRLKPGMYANVELRAPMGMSTTIPANALIDSGNRQIVFVAEADGYFQPRDVKVGKRLGDRVQILDGVKAGEQVAMAATFFLDSESQLRASVQNFEPAGPTSSPASATAEQMAIAFRTEPDPPRKGDNVFEVSVKDASGQPIEGADVSVTFFMAAMPSMNMPAMRSDTPLRASGAGVYRGTGEVMSGGRWDVTVNVSREGRRLGSRQLAVVIR